MLIKVPFYVFVLAYILVRVGYSENAKSKDRFIILKPDPYDIQMINDIPMTLDEKCKNGKLKIGYQNYTPYVDSHWSIDAKSGSLVGSAQMMSSAYEISKHFDDNDTGTAIDILFPVYGQEGKSSRKFKTFPFIPILTAPKIVVLVPDSITEDIGIRVNFLAQTIINAWPMWVFIMISTFLAGFCMWILDQKRNPKEFPPTFFAGSWDGVWWAFITMTTVGYGDLSPKSVLGRIFSMLWISLGVILISLFTGLVSAALNQTANPELNLAGSEVGAVRGSIEYQVGVENNADMRYYESHIELLEDLKNSSTTLHAAMIDNFALTAISKELNKLDIRVKKELNRPVTYGMVLAHNSFQTETCFLQFIKNHPQEIFESIAEKLSPVKNLSTVHVEVSAVGRAFYEQEIFKNIVYIECGLLIFALIIGITYEVFYRRQGLTNKNLWWNLRDREKSQESEECHELKPKINTDVITPATTDRKNIPEEIVKLLDEYEDYHNKWVERVKLFYKTPVKEKAESAHSSAC